MSSVFFAIPFCSLSPSLISPGVGPTTHQRRTVGETCLCLSPFFCSFGRSSPYVSSVNTNNPLCFPLGACVKYSFLRRLFFRTWEPFVMARTPLVCVHHLLFVSISDGSPSSFVFPQLFPSSKLIRQSSSSCHRLLLPFSTRNERLPTHKPPWLASPSQIAGIFRVDGVPFLILLYPPTLTFVLTQISSCLGRTILCDPTFAVLFCLFMVKTDVFVLTLVFRVSSCQAFFPPSPLINFPRFCAHPFPVSSLS